MDTGTLQEAGHLLGGVTFFLFCFPFFFYYIQFPPLIKQCQGLSSEGSKQLILHRVSQQKRENCLFLCLFIFDFGLSVEYPSSTNSLGQLWFDPSRFEAQAGDQEEFRYSHKISRAKVLAVFRIPSNLLGFLQGVPGPGRFIMAFQWAEQ